MASGGLWPLVAFAVISTATPGAATTLATASGAHFGFRRSVPLMAGAASGLATVAAAGAAGLAGVLLAMPSLQLVMRVAGSAYLIWLAWRVAQSGSPRLQAGGARPTGFVAGMLMLWYNPKGWAMSLSAAASFAALADRPVRLGVILGATFGLAALASLIVWCLAGQALRRLLRTDAQWRTLNVVLGVLLVVSIVSIWI
jgi:threonine/homoserine/homoserine lactone efflux protein